MRKIWLLSSILLMACTSHPQVNLSEIKIKAENGDAAAQNNLGVLYQKGGKVEKNLQEALRWYTQAANQSLPAAAHNLAWMYDQGLGTPEDDQEASRWYRQAAERGYSPSQVNLAIMLVQGKGISQDYVEAHKWLTEARMNGTDKESQWIARRLLCELEAKMSQEEIKEAGYSYSSMPFSNCESQLSDSAP